ncbi:MAG: hypothetical protein HY985_05555 [Magnetospirillum sp.]|nr:hypothetical protein [Magnetospirillum sp.]
MTDDETLSALEDVYFALRQAFVRDDRAEMRVRLDRMGELLGFPTDIAETDIAEEVEDGD